MPLEPEDLEGRLQKLTEYAQAAGRNPKEIRVVFKASLFDPAIESRAGRRRRFIGNAEQIASDVRDYQKVGVDCLILDVRTPNPAQTLERLDWLAQQVLPLV